MKKQLVRLLVASSKNAKSGTLQSVELLVVMAISAIPKTQHCHTQEVEVCMQCLFFFFFFLRKM